MSKLGKDLLKRAESCFLRLYVLICGKQKLEMLDVYSL